MRPSGIIAEHRMPFLRSTGIVDGMALCRMFNRGIRGQQTPKLLSSDHDPLYRFHQWQANLRVLDVAEIKTIPYVPLSVYRKTYRNDSSRMPGLHNVLDGCGSAIQVVGVRGLSNRHRPHAGLTGKTPEQPIDPHVCAKLKFYRWRGHCRGLFHTPIAA
jgi:putative transposase